MEPNPYQPPTATEPARAVCNFCGKTPDGPLVQAPEQEVYICAACARIAGGEIERFKTQSLPGAVFSLLLGSSLLILIAFNWFAWKDDSGLGLGASLLGTFSGMFMVGHFLSYLYWRWRR